MALSRVAGTPTAILDWHAVPFALAYNVYRGRRADLGDLACFIPAVGGLWIPDDGAAPALGTQLIYLVTAVSCGGESSLG